MITELLRQWAMLQPDRCTLRSGGSHTEIFGLHFPERDSAFYDFHPEHPSVGDWAILQLCVQDAIAAYGAIASAELLPNGLWKVQVLVASSFAMVSCCGEKEPAIVFLTAWVTLLAKQAQKESPPLVTQ